jgi:CubicO group peptidase (beta-lactamase class C family)
MDDKESPFNIRLQHLLADRSVMGASVAYVRKDSIEVAAAGLKDAETAAPVDVKTVFPVASLTKPIVSYAVLQLADAGVLDLDEPLSLSIPAIVPDDPMSALITFRHVLTHTCGLQNIRGKEPVRRLGTRLGRRTEPERVFPVGQNVGRQGVRAGKS